MVAVLVKIVVGVMFLCLFLSFLASTRKWSSVIQRHYEPLSDIYLGATPFLCAELCHSQRWSGVPQRHCFSSLNYLAISSVSFSAKRAVLDSNE